MLSAEHMEYLCPKGHYTVDGASQSVSAGKAAGAIVAGHVVRPGDWEVAKRMAQLAAGKPLAALLARVFGFDEPAAVVDAPAPEPAPVERVDPVDESARIRVSVEAAGDDIGKLRALAARLDITVSDRWSAKRVAQEITKVTAGRIAEETA